MFHCVFLLAPNACLCRHFKVYVSGISSVLRVQHQGPSINYVVSKSELFEPPSPLFFIMQGLFSKSSLGLLPTETTQFMDDSTLNRVYRVGGENRRTSFMDVLLDLAPLQPAVALSYRICLYGMIIQFLSQYSNVPTIYPWFNVSL